MEKCFKLGLAKIYIYKESGNLHVKNKEGVHSPVLYAAYAGDNEPIMLRDYMNLMNMNILSAAKKLDDCGVVLIGHAFSICFFDMESVDKFIEQSLLG